MLTHTFAKSGCSNLVLLKALVNPMGDRRNRIYVETAVFVVFIF